MTHNKTMGIIAGSPDRPLIIGDTKIECYVLDDGTRVLTQRAVSRALERGWGGSPAAGQKMPRFVSPIALSPFIDSNLAGQLQNAIPFKHPNGTIARGIPAETFPLICEVWLRARDAHVLDDNTGYLETAYKAELLMRGLAHVGIIALVDEVTGYQEKRAKDELQKILKAYIAPELLPWTKRFPDDFYKQLFRLQGWEYDPSSVKRPSYIGKLTNEWVYDKLPAGVLDELRKANPVTESGGRKHKHHQFLTDDVGNPHLKEHLQQVMLLMRISPNKDAFERLFNRAFPNKAVQQELDLPEGTEK